MIDTDDVAPHQQTYRISRPRSGISRDSTYAVWWIKAAIQDYILRSWSLVGISTTVNQKKLFLNLVTAKRQRSVFREGDLRPQRVSLIAAGLGVAANDVVDMNRRLSGDISLNVSPNQDGFRGVARPAGGRKYRPAPSY